MIHPAVAQFLESTAEARDTTDINIAAGIALEKLSLQRRPSVLRKTVATLAAIVALTVVSDAFAASPIHAGIEPIHTQHVLTHIPGAVNWDTGPGPNVFGHKLPWQDHDGWLEHLLAGF